MLWAFLHLTSQVEGSRDDKIRVRSADFDFTVETLEVDLGGRKSLLPHPESLTKSA